MLKTYFRILVVCLGLAAVIPVQAGVALWYVYDGYTGTAANLRFQPNFPLQMSRTFAITNNLGSQDIVASGTAGEDRGDNYGSFIRGYLEAPQTGSYKFYIESDDDSEVWLSTDESPENIRLIASDTACCHGWLETSPYASDMIPLERGRKYYFEVLHHEAGGADYVKVGWRLPDGTLERPILSWHFSPFPIDPVTSEPRDTKPFIIDGAYHSQGTNQNLVSGQPKNLSLAWGQAGRFEVSAEASQPAYYQWRRNGEPIPGAILSAFSIDAATFANNGARYDVVITNNFGSVTSAVAVLTVTGQPQVRNWGNTNGVDVWLPASVDPAIGKNPANYTLSTGAGAVPVTGVKLIDPDHVRIVAPTPDGSLYTIQTRNLKDPQGAAVADFSGTFVVNEDYILRKFYTDIPGNFFTDLANSTKYIQDQPDLVDYTPRLEKESVGTDNGPFEVNYGVSFRGYFNPPASGNYQFFVWSDDETAIYISTDANPANKQLVGLNPWAQGSSFLPSAPLPLTGGNKYYVEFLYKEGGGGDVMEVVMTLPGETPPIPGTPASLARYFNRYGARLGEVKFTSTPRDTETYLNQPADFTASVDGALPYSYQWYVNGVPVNGATTDAFHIGSAGANLDKAKVKVVARNRFSEVTSEEVTLIVHGATPPTLTVLRNGSDIVLTWSAEDLGAVLQTRANLLPATTWEDVPGSEYDTTYPVQSGAATAFYRLIRR